MNFDQAYHWQRLEQALEKLDDKTQAAEIKAAFKVFVEGRPYKSHDDNWDAVRKVQTVIIPTYEYGWETGQRFVGLLWDFDLYHQPRWKTPIKRIKK